ncbi:MAG TPA: DNA-3-methyladenine glycosylase [Bdellovibrionota bacterium]|nr:DNA-3-methyladenine glycosylase [Bdellovibrionota bacterium]
MRRHGRILPRPFYARPALVVAPELLGKVLCHASNGTLASGRIVEVEAYLDKDDPASHAYRGKTPRNSVMFGPAGFAYVYFTYGNHHCFNVVTGEDGMASAVLIRALEPLKGIEAMRRRRKKRDLYDLTTGPGKLTQALRIDRGRNGADLTQRPLWIEEDGEKDSIPYIQTPRIGISEGMDFPYRFLRSESSFVSKRVRSQVRP